MQYAINDEFARPYGPRHTWLAFIHADEFIETRANESLRSILSGFGQDDSAQWA
jgi:hypothetical protein